ncbi:MAG: hemolysin III family protein [Pirellulales bacterium]|nr:hemolysin III family protein [Pirellulales bacterium]
MLAEINSIPGFCEPFSSISHLLGAVFFAVLSFFLLRCEQRNRLHTISLAVFCLGTVLLLLISGVYHLLSYGGDARAVLRILDHAAIFILIACTFTPIHVIAFRGWQRWGMLGLIWTIAVVAITVKTIYFKQIPSWLNLSMYLGMGWLGVFPGITLWRRHGFRFVQTVLWGGLAYSAGVVLETSNWLVLLPGVVQKHEIFHIAVLVGLGFHWAFIYQLSGERSAD